MAQVLAFEDIPPQRARQRTAAVNGAPGAVISTFFKGGPDDPHAALNEYEPGETRTSAPHFHQVDQFQLVLRGRGMLGRHPVVPGTVHFSRAFTPYGPLHSDKVAGWAFIVMRAHLDAGAQRLPQNQDRLLRMTDRNPWQITRDVRFAATGPGVQWLEEPDIRNEQGLFVRTLVLAPGATAQTPDHTQGDGQYLVVTAGSLVHEGRERGAPTLVFLRPRDPALRIEAGPQGLSGVVLNFPRAGASSRASQ